MAVGNTHDRLDLCMIDFYHGVSQQKLAVVGWECHPHRWRAQSPDGKTPLQGTEDAVVAYFRIMEDGHKNEYFRSVIEKEFRDSMMGNQIHCQRVEEPFRFPVPMEMLEAERKWQEKARWPQGRIVASGGGGGGEVPK